MHVLMSMHVLTVKIFLVSQVRTCVYLGRTLRARSLDNFNEAIRKATEILIVFYIIYMSEFMKTVLKTLHQNSGHVFGKSVRKCT